MSVLLLSLALALHFIARLAVVQRDQISICGGFWMRVLCLFLALCFFGPQFAAAAVVANVKVTVLSTMLADQGIGEWGFAALVDADGRQLLIDTGARPDTVLQNARELGIDLSHVPTVVLTHFHSDHVGGLMTLRAEMKQRDPTALSVTHVATGIFYCRPKALSSLPGVATRVLSTLSPLPRPALKANLSSRLSVGFICLQRPTPQLTGRLTG